MSKFEQEILEYQKRGLEYLTFWSVRDEAFWHFGKLQLHPQIWVIVRSPDAKLARDEQIEEASAWLLSLVECTRMLGSCLDLYHRGDWLHRLHRHHRPHQSRCETSQVR